MPKSQDRVEYITIVGNDFEEVAQECRAQRLGEKHFTILHPIARHHFAVAGTAGLEMNLSGKALVSATYARRVRT